MSLYNMVMGYNPACYYFLPLLGIKYEDYPRFRDCFLSEDKEHIEVYTRTGGGNRESYQSELSSIYSHPNYEYDYDDDYDNTYMTIVFSVPDEWKEDFKHFVNGEFALVSNEYKNLIKEYFPKAGEKLISIIEEQSETSDSIN